MNIEFTIVGLDLEDYFRMVFMKQRGHINKINSIKYGRLGNFRTLTYLIEFNDPGAMDTRKAILNDLSQPGSPVICLDTYGTPDKVYIFRMSAFKRDEDEEVFSR